MQEIIDIHSHILFGIDDGSRSLEESIEMLRMEKAQGINHVVATPHFYPQRDNSEAFLKRRETAEIKLREAIKEHPDMPELSIGSEVYYFKGISDSKIISELAIAKKKTILIEMPTVPWTDYMYRDITGLYEKQGLTPIIAHVERYLKGFKSFADINKLNELPVLIQANADFFINLSTSCKAIKMLKEDKIHLLGSDCHGVKVRSPNLKKALELIEKRAGKSVLSQIASYEKIIFEA